MLRVIEATLGLCFVKEGQEKRGGGRKEGWKEGRKKERGGRYIHPHRGWSLPKLVITQAFPVSTL